VTPLESALRRMRRLREVANFHRGFLSLVLFFTRLMRASESIARRACGRDMTNARAERCVAARDFSYPPLEGEGRREAAGWVAMRLRLELHPTRLASCFARCEADPPLKGRV